MPFVAIAVRESMDRQGLADRHPGIGYGLEPVVFVDSIAMHPRPVRSIQPKVRRHNRQVDQGRMETPETGLFYLP